MRSRTKVDLDETAIRRVAAAALGGAEVTGVRSLDGGMFNAAYALRLGDGRDVVLKVAPPDDAPLLTYERDLMRTEVDLYQRAAGVVPVPDVLGTDFSRTVLDRDLFVMSHLSGAPLSSFGWRLRGSDRAAVRRELGAITARLATITGTRFGYARADGALSAPTWSGAFAAMTAAVVADADAYGVRLPAGADALPDLAAAAAAELDLVTVPSLVHFDLWDGNVFVARTGAGRRVEAVVDGERAFWGDPLAELASTALFRDPRRATDFLAGYASASGRELDLGAGPWLRVQLYRAYLYLIMLAEAAPRGYDGAEHRLVRAFTARRLAREVRDLRRELG